MQDLYACLRGLTQVAGGNLLLVLPAAARHYKIEDGFDDVVFEIAGQARTLGIPFVSADPLIEACAKRDSWHLDDTAGNRERMDVFCYSLVQLARHLFARWPTRGAPKGPLTQIRVANAADALRAEEQRIQADVQASKSVLQTTLLVPWERDGEELAAAETASAAA